MKKCLFLWALALMVAGGVCSCSKSDGDDSGGESTKPAYEDAAINNMIVGYVFECVEDHGWEWAFGTSEIGKGDYQYIYPEIFYYLKHFLHQEGTFMQSYGYYVYEGQIHIKQMTGTGTGWGNGVHTNRWEEVCTVTPTLMTADEITATAVLHKTSIMPLERAEQPQTIHLKRIQ